MGSVLFYVIFAITIFVDFILVSRIFSRKDKNDNRLGAALLVSALVTISYYSASTTDNAMAAKVLFSLYFSGITLMLTFLLRYILAFTNLLERFNKRVVFASILSLIVLADIIIELLNPYLNLSISFAYRADSVSKWIFVPGFLFEAHLTICYILIAGIFFSLIYRIIRTPQAYKRKYEVVFLGILFIVVLNAVFLIFQGEKDDVLDYSIFFYSIIGVFIYWNRYYYSTHGMLSKVRQLIFDELDKPVFLFDRDSYLAMSNTVASKFLKCFGEDEMITLYQFVDQWNMPAEVLTFDEEIHFQWNNPLQNTIFRIDVKRLRDKKNNRTIGKLLVMTDRTLEMDLLTGFHSKNTFETFFKDRFEAEFYPVGIAICDINKLSQINKNLGENIGDQAVLHLATLMKKHFPKGTYFARLEDANLLAVLKNTDSSKMPEYLEKIRQELKEIEGFGQVLEMQSAISVATLEKNDILAATQTAMFSMRSKKLMDGNSAHSSLLDSLAQTLLESDNTTRDHVQRTKEMGERLGKRLNFSDIQQSNLALLCLLHDIGKLGIPLEILNKPGKLNSAEWDVMKSHVEKGYRIAKASAELEDIAELILHHHESWNGKGYPDGMQQESIPLLSRVIAVVDTYDAMTNDRPYHKAISDAEAREELKRCAGVQFDPSIVSSFIELLEELHPLENQKNNNLEKNEQEKQEPRGVKEVFSVPVENDNIQPIKFARYFLDSDYKVLSMDGNFTELTGYTQEDLEKYNLRQNDLIPVEDLDSYEKIALENLNKTNEAYIEHRLLRKDGSTRDVVCFGRLFFDSVTHQPRIEIVVFDVSGTNAFGVMRKAERESAKRIAQRWERLMRRDSLTGILNHESFVNDVELELLKDDQKIVLLILDVDFFKNYNDSYGHLEGDKLLSLVAVMLETSVKEYGFSGRLGGDEFAAVLKLPQNYPAEKIQTLVNNVFDVVMNATSSQEYAASISMGAAVQEGSCNFNKLYQEADHALYRAKDNGRKCISF